MFAEDDTEFAFCFESFESNARLACFDCGDLLELPQCIRCGQLFLSLDITRRVNDSLVTQQAMAVWGLA